MLITFTVKDQKVTHDLGSRPLVAGSDGIVRANLVLDESWDDFDVVVVFTNSNKKKCGAKPVRWSGDPIDIPTAALVAGKLYISIIGFGDGNRRKTTLKWDIQQAITVQECGDLGACDLLRNMASESVGDDKIATDKEVGDMLDDVFGAQEQPSSGDDENSQVSGEPTVNEDDVATDEEVNDMLDDVFGDN